jgi:hypothetical protein
MFKIGDIVYDNSYILLDYYLFKPFNIEDLKNINKVKELYKDDYLITDIFRDEDES